MASNQLLDVPPLLLLAATTHSCHKMRTNSESQIADVPPKGVHEVCHMKIMTLTDNFCHVKNDLSFLIFIPTCTKVLQVLWMK